MSVHAFRDNVVVITGGSHGIGEEMALAMARQGARLSLGARRADELERVAAACRAAGSPDVITVVTDVAEQADCARLIETTAAHFRRIDTLVNNAGLGMWAKVEAVKDFAIFGRLMQVNYLGTVFCTAAALPHLKKTRGRIVGIASIAGRTGVPTRSGYVASKHAMIGFLDSLRIELRGSGVTVTVINPGFVGTGLQARNLGPDGMPLGTNPVNVDAVMTAVECARLSVQAAGARKRELTMTFRGKIGQWLKLLLPDVVDGIAAKAIARGK